MSLYYETAPFLSPGPAGSSLKIRVFGAGPTKCPATQIFALASETSKWSPILAEVIENAQLLHGARKLTPNLALLLVHDLLITKRGISAPTNHPLRIAVEAHKARLVAELTRVRLRRGFASLELLRRQVKEGLVLDSVDRPSAESIGDYNGSTVLAKWAQPRWFRVNTLKTTVEDQLKTTFAECEIVPRLDQLLGEIASKSGPKQIHIDENIPGLLALPPNTDLSKVRAYLDGSIILQDKASCFPASLMDPAAQDVCLDACAAPGNKTTHLAAIQHEKGLKSSSSKISLHASERDLKRASVLDGMLRTAGASDLVRVHRQDFLKLDPTKPPFSSISALLLDPSCSGSGIVGRDDCLSVTLPRTQTEPHPDARPKKKRKRIKQETEPESLKKDVQEEAPVLADKSVKLLEERLAALSDFQMRLLLHAFQFPKAHKITYSTCSIYAEENENVIIKALLNSHTKNLGWRLLSRHEQVSGLQAWNVRGDFEACRKLLSDSNLDARVIAEACIRCEKGTKEGTQGFFVAAFVRDVDFKVVPAEEEDEEWNGFDDA